ncbi:MAG TPA: hypothetical protein VM261_38440 [Kofleriaceae bacterium]|nr:hypothetical protein [Kofleriaceae bacterium]
MSVKAWALKPGELKRLSRAAQLRLAARCAMRVEPWMPAGAKAAWRKGLDHIARAASSATPAAAEALLRTIDDKSVEASERLEDKDELRAQCVSYAGLTLSTALEACALETGPTLTKAVIDTAKYAASIAALHAHAGRVKVGKGKDPVEVAARAMWDAIRADLPVVAASGAKLTAGSVRKLAPLWPAKPPTWAT